MKIVFLDIDGVLNGHEWIHRQGGRRINPKPASHLNILLARTGAKVVISSTWRSWVNRGWMTVEGFGAMLRSHGIDAEVVDVLPRGTTSERDHQIRDWVRQHKDEIESYVAIDDLDLKGVPLVRTRPDRGMTAKNITDAVKMLSA